MRVVRIAAGTAILLVLLTADGLMAPVDAADRLPAPVDAWFTALERSDGAQLAELLAPQARIDLRDLGIVQSRDEFLESLDAWEDAMHGGRIETRLRSVTADRIVVAVCYRFESNQQGNLETFMLEGQKVTLVVQEKTDEECAGF